MRINNTTPVIVINNSDTQEFPAYQIHIPSHLEDGDIRDPVDSPGTKQFFSTTGNTQAENSPTSFFSQIENMPLIDQIKSILQNFLQMYSQPQSNTEQAGPLDTDDIPSTKKSGGSNARNLQEAAANTDVQLKPVIRGDEAELDAQVHDQASFGRLTDQVANEYGLDPNQFRAQLEAESCAFSNGYEQAMRHEGDPSRAADNNTSVGMGQISRKFLDGREWSDALSGSKELGKQTISTEQYMGSVTTQLRLAAASTALRTERTGSLDGALREYVSGHKEADNGNQIYIDNINRHMKNLEWMNIGR